MDRDPRLEELEHLRLALATFALHLDAFEAQIESVLPRKIVVKEAHRAVPPNVGLANKIVSAMKSADRTSRSD